MKTKKSTQVTCLFLDIGGVLLTDGWNMHARKRAAANFDLDFPTMEDRHHLVFPIYEEGKLSLEEYLGRTVFFTNRTFTPDQFREFMFAQSRADIEMIQLIRTLKTKHGLKTVVVSNEARELNEYRIRKFGLDEFIDAFVSSCFVGMRKPDPNIFHLALDIAQVPADRIVYIENTAMHVDVAESLGIKSILHTDHGSTRKALARLGLRDGVNADLTAPERVAAVPGKTGKTSRESQTRPRRQMER